MHVQTLISKPAVEALYVSVIHGFGDWGEVFGDSVMATAILDRLLHHTTTVNIKGESYRLKEKRKAGLLTKGRSSAKIKKEVSSETDQTETVT